MLDRAAGVQPESLGSCVSVGVVLLPALLARVVVRLAAEHRKPLVERELHDPAGGEPDLDTVRGAVVTGLRLDDRPATRVRERRGARSLARGPCT